MELTVVFSRKKPLLKKDFELVANAKVVTDRILIHSDYTLNTTGSIYSVVIGNDYGSVDELEDKFTNSHKNAILSFKYDSHKEKISLKNDHFGGIQLFYFVTKDRFICSTDFYRISNLIPEDRRVLDWEAASELIDFGYVLYDKTLIKGITRYPYATEMEINQEKVDTNRYWDFNINEDFSNEINVEDLVGELSTHLRDSVIDCLPDNKEVIIPLSGGLDSRLILAVAIDQMDKKNITAYTFGQKNTQDLEIAKKVTEYLGVRHITEELKSDFHKTINTIDWEKEFLNRLNSNYGLIEATPYSQPLESYENLKDYGDYLFSGYMGGELFGSHLSKSLLESIENFDIDLQEIYKRQKNNNRSVLKNHVIGDIPNVLHNKLSKYKTKAALNMHWDFSVRQQNYIKYGQKLKYQDIFNVKNPFIAPSLVEFANSKIPFTEKLDERIYFKTLMEVFPKVFKEIPTTHLGGMSYKSSSFAKNFILKGMKKVNQISNRRVFPISKKLNYRDYSVVVKEHNTFRQFLTLNYNQALEMGLIYMPNEFNVEEKAISSSNITTLCRIASLNLAVQKFRIKVS